MPEVQEISQIQLLDSSTYYFKDIQARQDAAAPANILYGKVAAHPTWELGTYNDSGAKATGTTYTRTSEYFVFSSNYAIIPTNVHGNLQYYVFYYNSSGTFLEKVGPFVGPVYIRNYAPTGAVRCNISATSNTGSDFISSKNAEEVGNTILITNAGDGTILKAIPQISVTQSGSTLIIEG